MLTLASSKLTGIPGVNSWSQVHDFLPEDDQKLKTRGHLFAVIAAKELGREILTRLHEEYFGETTIKPFNALKLAVEKVGNEFSGIEISAISFVGGVIYSAAIGGSKVIILRDGALATILASKLNTAISASGFPKIGDLILLGTSAFFDKVSEIEIKSALETSDLTNASEIFNGIIHKSEESGNIAAAVVRFDEGMAVPGTATIPASPKVSFIEKIRRILPERKIYIKTPINFESSPQSKKTTLLVGVILLVILAVSITFGVRQKNVKEKENQIAQMEQKASELDAAGHYNVTTELFLDLTLLSSGFKGDVVSTSGNDLFVLDKNGKRVIGIEMATKKSRVVAGTGKLEEAFDIATYEDRVFVLGSGGVSEVKEDVVSVIEKSWDGEVLIHSFAGNLYILDKQGGQIFRYQGSDETFGTKQDWLSSSTKPDLTAAKSWTFDGSIYILTVSGKVLKFSGGSPQNFSLPVEVLSTDSIFANDENEFLYILDKIGKKVVVVEKSGKFKAQYSADKISEAVGLIASEAERKIILLTGEKLHSIDIK